MFQPLNLGLKFITNLFLSWWRPYINSLLFQLLILTMGLMVKCIHTRLLACASNQNLKAGMDLNCPGPKLDKLHTSSIPSPGSWWWFDFINYLRWLSESPPSLQSYFIDGFLVLSLSFHNSNANTMSAIISISPCLVVARRFSIAYQDNWNTFIIWPGMLIS